MSTRRILLPILTVFILLSGTTARGSAEGDFAAGAEAFVRSMADQAIVSLTDPGITRVERKARMRRMMDEYFFVPGIAQWVMGRFWRQATDEQRDEYVELYEDLMIETYVDRFATYKGETLEVTKTDVRDGKDAIVTSTLLRPEINETIQIDWRVRASQGQYKIIDIMVEGVSMGQTQRSEFASAIKSNGGDIGKFLEDLRLRIASASAETDSGV